MKTNNEKPQKYEGEINGYKIYTDENMVVKNGFEYKRVRMFKFIPFLWKTIKVINWEPVREAITLEEKKCIIMHPDAFKALVESIDKGKKQ